MKKLLFGLILPFLLVGCSNPPTNSGDTKSSSGVSSKSVQTGEESFTSWPDENSNINKEEKDMLLEIDNQKIDVTWENNASVSALKALANPSLTIDMHRYGGFEQTGEIGQSIVRNDSQIDTEPGDIVLYNGNQISVFYEPSSWSYTRLGHINMSKSELNALLNKESVVFVLKGDEIYE